MRTDLRFVDTTVRDGNQSLWGLRMPTGMILTVAAEMDKLGFEAIEAESAGSWKIRVRQQHEEPWERIRLMAKKITRTPLSTMAGATDGAFRIAPYAFARLRLERQAANGLRRVNIMEASNDMRFRIPEIVRFAQNAGLQAVLALVYSVSPKHSDEHFARKAGEAAKLKPDRMYLKDPGGLLTPERVRTLIPAIQKNIGDLTLELHSHCTTGLAPLCYLEAAKLGVSILHTGIPPLANGSAQPSILNVSRNARLLGFQTEVDEARIKPISDHFRFWARREGFPLGVPLEYDYAQYIHQIPGGVISNLRRQLSEMKMGHRLEEVLKESIEVRKDLGYPIMVTPYSQHVVTQAALNVILGERYKEVPEEVIRYALGYWGAEAAADVDPQVKAKILDRSKAKDLAQQEHEEPTLEDLRQSFGSPGLPDDELVLRYAMGGRDELDAMRPAAPVQEYPSVRTPLVVLIHELAKKKGWRYVSIEKPGMSLSIRR